MEGKSKVSISTNVGFRVLSVTSGDDLLKVGFAVVDCGGGKSVLVTIFFKYLTSSSSFVATIDLIVSRLVKIVGIHSGDEMINVVCQTIQDCKRTNEITES